MSESNKRDHFRVEMTVPVKWKILTDDEIKVLKNGKGSTLFKQSGMPSQIDSFLEEAIKGSQEEKIFSALKLLNNKLDYLIEQVLSKSSGRSSNNGNIMEISASGLKFNSEEGFKEGTFLLMELMLPGVAQYNMELITEILRVIKKKDKYENAARIVCMKDGDRDSIIKLVFQKQRMDIRNTKTQEDKN